MGRVHAKGELVIRSQVAGLGLVGDFTCGIMHDESVGLSEQRHSGTRLKGTGVPRETLRLLHRHVGGQSVCFLVLAARRKDVDG